MPGNKGISAMSSVTVESPPHLIDFIFSGKYFSFCSNLLETRTFLKCKCWMAARHIRWLCQLSDLLFLSFMVKLSLSSFSLQEFLRYFFAYKRFFWKTWIGSNNILKNFVWNQLVVAEDVEDRLDRGHVCYFFWVSQKERQWEVINSLYLLCSLFQVSWSENNSMLVSKCFVNEWNRNGVGIKIF